MAKADSGTRLVVNVSKQTLSVLPESGDQSRLEYVVSTAENGVGQWEGSGCTPLGRHYIRAKIGRNAPLGAVFVGRRWTGEIYSAELAQQYPNRDWILSRILWLCGLQRGMNRGGQCDTMRRFIYIHGTPDTEPMGVPKSHGCIRMRNHDVITLFDYVQPFTVVEVVA
jgi:lipoprotein-anchoring transpeptidase ErfK/SrfK